MTNSNKALGHGILVILVANIINMVFSLVTNFVLPKYLSVDTYAVIKTYQLYLSYAGLFHLGYSDGAYLKYGGKNFSSIDKHELAETTSTMRGFQFGVTLIVLAVSFVVQDSLIAAFALGLFGYNMLGYFKNVYQAVGEFKNYSRVLNIVAILNFVGNMALIAVVRSDFPYAYISLYIFVDILVWCILEWRTYKFLDVDVSFLAFDFHKLIQYIKDGILLLFGNLTSIFLTGMDRWFTKFLLLTVDFAQYSFAVSVENMLNVAITPISVTLYNYLCKRPSTDKIKKLRAYVTIFSVFLVAAFFPAKFIIEIYLQNYYDALAVIAFLFASQIFYVIIKSIYVNLYNANHQQKRYFQVVLIVIVVGFLFNVICYLTYHKKESFAFGTLCSAIAWYIICQIDFKNIALKLKEILYIAFQLAAFLFFALSFNSIIGFTGYILVTIIFTFVFMKQEFSELAQMGLDYICSLKRKHC